MKRLPRHLAALGFTIALLIAAVAYYQNSHNYVRYEQRVEWDNISEILCPLCIGLMATEQKGVFGQSLIVLLVSIVNASVYGALGFFANWIFSKVKSRER